MKVLIGTTNPSKVKRFAELLGGHDVEFCTLKDLRIEAEPEEMGTTPEENAVIKAKFTDSFLIGSINRPNASIPAGRLIRSARTGIL